MDEIPERIIQEVIKPTTTATKGEDVVFTLEDKDYLLIKSIQNLTNEISKLRLS